jgi:hypothetical protein
LKIKLFIVVSFLFSIAYGQQITNLNPSYVHTLDFSDKAKAEWALRDTLLSQLSSGMKDWDKMTADEKALFEKYSEVYENIWDRV